jgi:DNA polymerase delta subunit 2
MYFLRLTMLKPAVEKIAAEAWNGFQIAGEEVRKVNRVLDVRQGQLCWVSGTVYMDMPLKPNILDDISKDVHSPCPPLHAVTDECIYSIGLQRRLLAKSTSRQLAMISRC